MAPKKIMLWPSARSKFVKDGNMKLMYYALLALGGLMVIQNYYLYSFMYGIKLALMIGVSLLITRETEILFYTHDKGIMRLEAKELIEKSYWRVTALIYALLIPIGTPLWLVGLGAALATLLGKLLFGGFHHMVFHSSLVGVIFVTLGWSQLVDGVAFATAFDNYILELLFDNALFNDTLAIGGLFDPATMDTALSALLVGTPYNVGDVLLGLTPGVIASGILVVGLLVFFSIKKVINPLTPLVAIGSFLITALIIGVVQHQDMMFSLYHLFSGTFLFIVVFVVSDPITTPLPKVGKIIFGIIVGFLTMMIRISGTHEEGIVFAVLFMNMLTPLLNEVFKEQKKVVPKKVVSNNE
jgi:electron transport complex protein RnfD